MRRWLWPAGLYIAITIAMAFPLLARLSSAFPHDAGDPVLNTWILWWSTQRVPFTQAWWNAPMFFPMPAALALSEVLVGLLPITAVVQFVSGSPLTAYNVAFLLSFPFCGLAAYALALELTDRRDAAVLAGLAFAFAPYRIGQLSHIQMLSYYWAPVALLGLHRYGRRGDGGSLAIFAFAWLMQALSNGYAIFHLGVLVALWLVWFVRSPRKAAPIVVAWLVGTLPALPVLLEYREVHGFLHLTRDINEIKRFGVDVADFLAAAPDNLLWGSRLWPPRPETAVFPGATLVVLGALWLLSSWRRQDQARPPRTLDERILIVLSMVAAIVALSTIAIGPWRLGPLSVREFHKPFSLAVGFRILATLRGPWMRRVWNERSTVAFYAVAMVTAYVIALGPEPRLLGRLLLYEPPYAWLMRLPGFDVMRVPARFAMMGVLCQAMILAFGVVWLTARARRAQAVVLLIGVGLVADGWMRLPVEAAPAEGLPPGETAMAVVELPAGGTNDFGALYRAISHGRPVVNGFSGYYPPHYLPFTYAIRDGQYSALYEIAGGRPLSVAVSRTDPGASAIETALASMSGVIAGPADHRWASYTVTGRAQEVAIPGPAVAARSIRVNRFPQDAARMTDGNIETSWAAGLNQIGDEELIVDLGSTQNVGSVVFKMGAFAFGFPRALEIDSSQDGTTWDPVWRGQPAVLTVHAAIAEPGVVPLTIDLGRVTTRYLRLRQTGSEPGIPWWIPELTICAPAP